MSFHLPPSTRILMAASALALAASGLVAQEVTDPSTGETVDLAEINFATLDREDVRAIAEELEATGLTREEVRDAIGEERRADIGAVEVVDPTTGETVALSEIDKDSLSEEDRQDIGDQLAEQGVSLGRGGRGGRGGEAGEGEGRGRPGGHGGRDPGNR